MLPRAVNPFVNVSLNSDAVVVDCPLMTEELIDQFFGFFTVWEQRKNIETYSRRVGLRRVPLALRSRASERFVNVIRIFGHKFQS